MKHVIIIAVILAVAVGIGFTSHILKTKERLETKLAHIKTDMQAWTEDDRDPDAALALMQKVTPAIKDGDIAGAEKLMDQAQALLDVPPEKRPRPQPAPGEEPSDLYINPKPVEITGYDGSAMEPFISPDGHFLFFNNENDAGAQTDLQFAERTGPNRFHYLGKLTGANSDALDAAASIDKAGNIYFTTAREYEKSLKSIYTGKFDGHQVTDAHVVAGAINPFTHDNINMDVSISPDGDTLYISRAFFQAGLSGPKESDLMVAHRHGDAFDMDPHTADIMKNINTSQLEYAPDISADGRELFFTRAQAPTEDPVGPQFRIMVATRSSTDAPFGKPRALSALTGAVEAPSVSLDLSEMFFHKKVKGKWVIYRAVRKGSAH